MSKINYNFEFLIPKDDPVERVSKVLTKNSAFEQIWPNLRITKCCGNCAFFWYRKRHERRGYCKLPEPAGKDKNINQEDAINNWPRRHVTNICDNHELRSQIFSVDRVSEWVEQKFLPDGSLDLNAIDRKTNNKSFE